MAISGLRGTTQQEVTTRQDFSDACNGACGCAAGVLELRNIWDRVTDGNFNWENDTLAKGNSEILSAAILRLAYHVKRSRTLFPPVSQRIRSLRDKRPKPIAGVSAPSYHDQAIKLAEKAVWIFSPTFLLGREILDLVDGPEIPQAELSKTFITQREPVAARIRQRISEWRSTPGWYESECALLAEHLPVIDADALISSIQKEMALAAAESDGQAVLGTEVFLTPEAKTILESLAKEVNMSVTQEDLANATRLSLPTIRKNLTYLRDNGLVNRPHGSRKGDAITTKGRNAISDA